MGVHYSSETPEWYTPPEIIERTQKTLGKIDLDPCAGPEETVPATRSFSKQDDGLRFEVRWLETRVQRGVHFLDRE